MESPQVKTAIIGIGRWGKNLAQELNVASSLVAYASSDIGENDAWAKEHIPAARRMGVEEICADASITAVVIATPILTHAMLARTFLLAGKHVFVEKPLAETSAEARELAQLAKDKGLVLMTGYIFTHHPVYQELKKVLAETPPKDVTLVWNKYGTFSEPIELNLLTHHLSIAYNLLGMPVNGTLTEGTGVESACDSLEVHLTYPKTEVHSFINRATEKKEHLITVTTADDRNLVWNGSQLLEGEKILFEDATPPLQKEVQVFVAASAGTAPLPDPYSGVQVLLMHEMLQR